MKPIAFCYPLERTITNPFAELTSIGILFFCVFIHICMLLEHVRIFPAHGSRATQQARQGGSAMQSLHRLPWSILTSIPTAYAGLTMFHDTAHAASDRQNIFGLLQDTISPGVSRSNGSRWTSWLSQLLSPRVARVTIYAAELALFALNCMLFYQYIQTLHPGEGYRLEDFSKWTLGQVIAVTIWFSVLFEFLWDCYRGIARTRPSRRDCCQRSIGLSSSSRMISVSLKTGPHQLRSSTRCRR